MSCDQTRLLDYLEGGLDACSTEGIDAHLLACNGCWSVVHSDRVGYDLIRAGRETAPRGLIERVQLAVRLSPPPTQPRQTWRVAALAAVVAVVVGVSIAMLPTDRADGPDLVAVASAFAAPPGSVDGAPRITGAPVEITRMTIDGTPVVVARSDRPFPMPPGAEPIDGVADAWAVQQGRLTIVCVNQPDPRLVVGSLGAGQLLDATS